MRAWAAAWLAPPATICETQAAVRAALPTRLSPAHGSIAGFDSPVVTGVKSSPMFGATSVVVTADRRWSSPSSRLPPGELAASGRVVE